MIWIGASMAQQPYIWSAPVWWKDIQFIKVSVLDLQTYRFIC